MKMAQLKEVGTRWRARKLLPFPQRTWRLSFPQNRALFMSQSAELSKAHPCAGPLIMGHIVGQFVLVVRPAREMHCEDLPRRANRVYDPLRKIGVLEVS